MGCHSLFKRFINNTIKSNKSPILAAKNAKDREEKPAHELHELTRIKKNIRPQITLINTDYRMFFSPSQLLNFSTSIFSLASSLPVFLHHSSFIIHHSI
ncbi:MAG: hypothetical protein NT166_14835 [Candidatus Aminicenantes bacterium]|nr:hypothetical protein [Candidatus Aminicenantes bacterium]